MTKQATRTVKSSQDEGNELKVKHFNLIYDSIKNPLGPQTLAHNISDFFEHQSSFAKLAEERVIDHAQYMEILKISEDYKTAEKYASEYQAATNAGSDSAYFASKKLHFTVSQSGSTTFVNKSGEAVLEFKNEDNNPAAALFAAKQAHRMGS